jgi:hypothetical protein
MPLLLVVVVVSDAARALGEGTVAVVVLGLGAGLAGDFGLVCLGDLGDVVDRVALGDLGDVPDRVALGDLGDVADRVALGDLGNVFVFVLIDTALRVIRFDGVLLTTVVGCFFSADVVLDAGGLPRRTGGVMLVVAGAGVGLASGLRLGRPRFFGTA